MEEERFIDGNPLDEGEVQAELSLRPQTFQQYIGQQKVKEELAVYIQAASVVLKPWITCCYTDLQDLGRRHLRWSLRMN